ncbi:Uncharacterized protein FWK35_00009717 [Aphis craccivora]|uniref:Uncharacterized protein n=1 Tax=Aphis craccivora TaxID=307492 RepID=A0A6G0YD11_APHCR|nr:Uncharacterized protein FWK35_00009717 [Aphis craccivora]
MRENRLRWLGHVLRREKTVTKNMSVDGKIGRPKKRWFEVIEYDMRMTDVCEEDGKDLSKCKLRTRIRLWPTSNSWERR